jgi:hypothetical protein
MRPCYISGGSSPVSYREGPNTISGQSMWVCGGRSGPGTVFSPTSSVFPCQYHCMDTPWAFTHLTPMLFDLNYWQRRETVFKKRGRKRKIKGNCVRYYIGCIIIIIIIIIGGWNRTFSALKVPKICPFVLQAWRPNLSKLTPWRRVIHEKLAFSLKKFPHFMELKVSVLVFAR